MKRYNVCLASKTIYHKPYKNLKSLQIITHYWKNFSMDFVIGLLLFVNWKDDSYDLILVIIDCLTKIMNYKPVKVTINAPKPEKGIIDIVV